MVDGCPPAANAQPHAPGGPAPRSEPRIGCDGIAYRPIGASALLRRNLWIYGLGGLIAPFIGIKLIDLIVHNVLGA